MAEAKVENLSVSLQFTLCSGLLAHGEARRKQQPTPRRVPLNRRRQVVMPFLEKGLKQQMPSEGT